MSKQIPAPPEELDIEIPEIPMPDLREKIDPEFPNAKAPRPRLDLYTTPTREVPMANISTVRELWDLISLFVEEAVQAAEQYTDRSGEEKKEFVKVKVLEWLKTAEGHLNVLPNVIEGALFAGLDFALDWMIERVFRTLDKQGLVNVPA